MNEQVFVGRERELAELTGYLDKALAGRGQVCFVTGQAGSGKTALVRQFVQQAFATDSHLTVAIGSCNAQTGIGDPYLPFREGLAMLTGDAAAQQAATKVTPENANRLRAILVRSVQVLVEVAPELIGVFVPSVTVLGHLGKAVAEKSGWMDHLDELAKRKVGASEVTEYGPISTAPGTSPGILHSSPWAALPFPSATPAALNQARSRTSPSSRRVLTGR